MASPFDLIILDTVSTTTSGPRIGIQAGAMEFAPGATGVGKVGFIPLEFVIWLADSTSGATGAVKLQSCPLGALGSVSFTDLITLPTFTIASGQNTAVQKFNLTLTDVYIRATVTAISGGSAPYFSGYFRRRQ